MRAGPERDRTMRKTRPGLGIVSSLILINTGMGAAVEIQPQPQPLARVRRIYVDQLAGGDIGEQMRDMLIAAVQGTGLFGVTDNPERADAVLKGSSDDQIFTDEHHTSDSLGLHVSDGSGSSSRAILGASTSSQRSMSAGITQNESSNIKERRHEAHASVRLINADGDIVWSATTESSGGKYRGAMADVADKIARRLADDTRRVRAEASATGPQPQNQASK